MRPANFVGQNVCIGPDLVLRDAEELAAELERRGATRVKSPGAGTSFFVVGGKLPSKVHAQARKNAIPFVCEAQVELLLKGVSLDDLEPLTFGSPSLPTCAVPREGSYSESFAKNSSARTEGTFERGLREGRWTRRFRDGSVHWFCDYQEGKPQGEFQIFHPGGRLRCTRHFDQGKLVADHYARISDTPIRTPVKGLEVEALTPYETTVAAAVKGSRVTLAQHFEQATPESPDLETLGFLRTKADADEEGARAALVVAMARSALATRLWDEAYDAYLAPFADALRGFVATPHDAVTVAVDALPEPRAERVVLAYIEQISGWDSGTIARLLDVLVTRFPTPKVLTAYYSRNLQEPMDSDRPLPYRLFQGEGRYRWLRWALESHVTGANRLWTGLVRELNREIDPVPSFS
jgi:hypothetical protein